MTTNTRPHPQSHAQWLPLSGNACTHTRLLHNPAAPEAPLFPSITRQSRCAFSVNTPRSPPGKELYLATQAPPLTQRAPRATQGPPSALPICHPRWRGQRSLPPRLQARQPAPPQGSRGHQDQKPGSYCVPVQRCPTAVSDERTAEERADTAVRWAWPVGRHQA